MEINLNISDVVVNTEFNSAEIVVTPTFSSGVADVNKKYVDDGLALKVDKVEGKGLSTNDYTNEDKISLANKVDKVANHSLVPDSEINKLAEYPKFEDLEFSHENLTDKNSEAAFQHVDTTTVKTTLVEADKVALYDSVTGKVVLSNALNDIETILASI